MGKKGRKLMHPDNIGQQFEWFHGTKANLTEGDTIVPGAELNKNNFPPAGDNSKVWLSNQAHHAAGWASRAARKGTVNVYQVTPETDPEDNGPLGYSTTRAKVVKKIWSGKAKI
jgi:hypothetical protein